MLNRLNPYVQAFEQHSERLRDQINNGQDPVITMWLVRNNHGEGRLNIPFDPNNNINNNNTNIIGGEIAAIFRDDLGNVPANISVNINNFFLIN
jgi:hypothetical protein